MNNLIDRFDVELLANLLGENNYSAVYARVIKMDQSSGWILYIKGICEDCLGNPYEALHSFKKALLIDPYNYDYIKAVTTNLNIFRRILLDALYDQEVGLGEIEKIHRFIKGAGELNSSLQYLVIKNYVIRGCYKEAEELLSNFLMNNPSDEEALSLERIINLKGNNPMAS